MLVVFRMSLLSIVTTTYLVVGTTNLLRTVQLIFTHNKMGALANIVAPRSGLSKLRTCFPLAIIRLGSTGISEMSTLEPRLGGPWPSSSTLAVVCFSQTVTSVVGQHSEN